MRTRNIPVLNKIDLPSANPEEVKDQIMDLIGCDSDDIIAASAKTGLGIEEILEAIIKRVPAPVGDPDAPLQALVFDSQALTSKRARRLKYNCDSFFLIERFKRPSCKLTADNL